MNVLIRLIQERFEQTYAEPPPREEVETFVREVFDERNIRPEPELVRRVAEHLLHGTPVGSLHGRNIKHCGSG